MFLAIAVLRTSMFALICAGVSSFFSSWADEIPGQAVMMVAAIATVAIARGAIAAQRNASAIWSLRILYHPLLERVILVIDVTCPAIVADLSGGMALRTCRQSNRLEPGAGDGLRGL